MDDRLTRKLDLPVVRLPEALDLRPGVVLHDTYRLVRLLASGGVGHVYLASHQRLPGQVAIKVLHGDLLCDEESLARFRREAEVLASLRHPHVVQVVDFNVTSSGLPYLVMELVEGDDLRHRCLPDVRHEPHWVALIVRQIAGALQFAHEQGVVHRDLKPENVMIATVAGEDFVKVLDFGLSKTGRATAATDPNRILGTPAYMAPEQVTGDGLDARVDQFALAVIAYELLSGRAPFQADSNLSILYQIVHQPPPPLAPLLDRACTPVEEVLSRALSKNPDDRYPDIMTFATALEAALQPAPQPEMPGATPAAPASEADSPQLLELGRSFLW